MPTPKYALPQRDDSSIPVSTSAAIAAVGELSERQAWKAFIVLLSSVFIMLEAAAFQAPAMPSITRHFGIPVSQAALILLLYYLGATVFAPIMGSLADRVGRKRMVLVGAGLFALAEFGAALSTSFANFLAARFVQGLGVACVLPVVLGFVSQLFPAHKRGLPLGIMSMAMTAGAVTGGMIAGQLIDRFGWTSVYWASGSLTLLGLILVALTVPELPGTAGRQRFDLAGVVLLFLAVGCLLSVPTLVGNFGMTSLLTLAAVLIGLASVALLWQVERRAPTPVVDLAVLRERAFGLAALIYLLHVLTFTGLIYALAFIISARPGGSASQVGVMTMFVYGSSLCMSPLAGWLADRMPVRVQIQLALGLTVVGQYLVSTLRVDTPMWTMLAIVSLLGFRGC